jgi:mono/diheme cytochrome c family protein
MQKLTMAALAALSLFGAAWLMASDARAQQDSAPAEQATETQDVERFEDGDAAGGEKLYSRYCAGCHGEDGRGAAHTFMPHVGNLAKKDYIEFLPDSYLFTVIADGGAAVGKNAYMPAWKAKLSEDEIKDVIAYIRTLPNY